MKPTPAKIYNACMTYRHDFGLLSPEEREAVSRQAVYWLEAWGKEFDFKEKKKNLVEE